jgi:hypothetical protein
MAADKPSNPLHFYDLCLAYRLPAQLTSPMTNQCLSINIKVLLHFKLLPWRIQTIKYKNNVFYADTTISDPAFMREFGEEIKIQFLVWKFYEFASLVTAFVSLLGDKQR